MFAGKAAPGYPFAKLIRELQNAIEHAVVPGTTELIRPEDLSEVLEKQAVTGVRVSEYQHAVKEVKRQLWSAAFRKPVEITRGRQVVRRASN